MTPLTAVERELAENAASLRALARDLVGADAADDLVQETALRALRSPPREPRSLGGWLATVLRRLAATHRRTARRRDRREAVAAVGEVLPAAGEVAARRDSLRAVTTALFALPEPYQSTLLLRYFEDLTPTAIAQRTGAPLATVKTRLQRGIAMLRGGLDRRERDWRNGLALATGIALPSAGLTLTTGVLLMAKTFKLAVAAALVVGAITAWQLGTAPLLPPTDGAAAAGNAAAVGAAAGSTPTQSPTTGREDLLTASLAAPDLAHPFEYELRCRVIDDHGLPAIGESVAITPLGCSENAWPAKTEWGGPLVAQWHGRSESMRVAVRVGEGPPHEFELHAAAPRELTLLAAGPSFQRLEVQFSAAADFEVVGTDTAETSKVLRILGNRIRGSHDVLAPANGMHPERLFCDRLLGGEAPANGVPVLSRLPIVSSLFLEVGGTRIGSLALLQETAAPAATGAIEGIVFGEDGEPAGGVLVCCCPTHEHPLQRAQTEADGTFRFEGLPLESFELRAGGGPEGLALTSALATANGAARATLQLRREQTIRGTALGRGLGPLSGWVVDYEALDGTWVDRATVGQDGKFVLANLPAGPGRLLLRQRPELLAAAIVPSVLPDSGEVAFALADDADPRGAIALRLPPESDGSVPAASFRAWQLDGNSAAALAPAKDGSLRIDNLPAGYYRIEGGIDGRGSSDLGTHYVDGKSTLDLGTVAAPVPGTLRLLHRPAHVAIELYQRRAHGDVRCQRDPGDEDELQLPTGNWLLFWKVGDEPPRALPFALQPGAVTEVDLGR